MKQIDKKIVLVPPKECCSARNVLWYLVLLGFAVNYMLRTSLNMTIISMVQSRPNSNISVTSECIPHAINSTLYHAMNKPVIEITTSKKFLWNEKEQSMVLGSIFWLHWVTQVPGGILGAKYGTKKVFGFSNLSGVLCVFLVPTAAHLGATALIILRVIQGFLAVSYDYTGKFESLFTIYRVLLCLRCIT